MRRNVKWVAENIVNGIEETHTIWDVTVETRENATVEVPVSRKEKYIVGRNRVSKLMCNYFSFGLDARIGFAFEKRRTKSRCCNTCVYACQGAKRMCICCKCCSPVLKIK